MTKILFGTDSPPKDKIETAAKYLQRNLKGEKTAVYLMGYGRIRDWYGGTGDREFDPRIKPQEMSIGHIFSQYNQNLVSRIVGMTDFAKGGIRFIERIDSRDLHVRGVHQALIFTTIGKHFLTGEPFLEDYLGALYGFLSISETLGIETFWTSATNDNFGYIHFPIEHGFKKKGKDYLGPHDFIATLRGRVGKILKANSHKLGKVDEATLEWLTPKYKCDICGHGFSYLEEFDEHAAKLQANTHNFLYREGEEVVMDLRIGGYNEVIKVTIVERFRSPDDHVNRYNVRELEGKHPGEINHNVNEALLVKA